MSRLLIFLVLLNAYILTVVLLYRRGKLGKDFDLVLGFLLMWRTQRGKDAIERISKPKGFWGVAGDVGIVLTVLAGAFTLLVVVLQVVIFALEPQQSAANTPGPQYLLGLPGVNPLIPIGYGILGLAIALVVHEGAHGVLARAGEIKVKSLGLLLAIVPIGAFVEPDEEELERASTRRKLRVFAAGPASNLVLALVAALLFSGVVMAAAHIDGPDGVAVRAVVVGGPAEEAGIRPGYLLTKVDGASFRDAAQFYEVMNTTRANQSVQLSYRAPGDREDRYVVVQLSDRGDYLRRSGVPAQDIPEWTRGKGALEVYTVDLEGYLGMLQNPLQSGGAFLAFLYHPFTALTTFDPLGEPFVGWIGVSGPLAAVPMPVFVGLALTLYWLFWLNLMLGTFNALPMGPLDGGQMLKATLRSRLYRRYGVDRARLVMERPLGSPVLAVRGADDETQAKLDRVNRSLRRSTSVVGYTILGMLLVPILVAYVLKAI